MSAATNNPAAAGPAADLQSRITRLEEVLKRERNRQKVGGMVTAIVGLAIIGLLAAWIFWGLNFIQGALSPTSLVQTLENMLVVGLPGGRKALEDEVKKNANKWAADLSQQAVKEMPNLREQLEDYIVGKADQAVTEGTTVTAPRFRRFLKANKPMLSEAFKALDAGPEKTEKFLGELEPIMEASFGRDMQGDADVLLATSRDLNARLEKLLAGKRLDEEEALERQMIMIAHRLQKQHADPSLSKVKEADTAVRSVVDKKSGDEGDESKAAGGPAEKPARATNGGTPDKPAPDPKKEDSGKTSADTKGAAPTPRSDTPKAPGKSEPGKQGDGSQKKSGAKGKSEADAAPKK